MTAPQRIQDQIQFVDIFPEWGENAPQPINPSSLRGSLMLARWFISRAMLASLLAGGCGGDPNGQQPVSGTVLFQGQPLDQGHLLFVPAVSGTTEAGATIEQGAFDIPQANGLVPGSYQVKVFSYDQSGAKVQNADIPGDPGNVQFKERIPTRYNTKTELTAEVKSGRNHFDFKLE